MTKNNNTPLLRFKDFTNSWEMKTLGECMENITSVKRIHQSDWTSSGIRFLRARDIVAYYNRENISEPLYISEEKYTEYSIISGKVKKDDLLVTGVGTIGVPMLIKDDKPIYFKDGNVIWFKNNSLNGEFLFYTFIHSTVQNYIKYSAGIGTVGTYTIESGNKTPVSIPQLQEQQQIGTFFQKLDRLIADNEIKLDKLHAMKKALLTKMFPQQGVSTPSVRFRGFVSPWGMKTLGEILTLGRGRVISKEDIQMNQGIYPVYSSQTTNNGMLGSINTYDFDGEYLTWTTDGANAGTVFYRSGKFNCTNVCGTGSENNPNISIKFICIASNLVAKKYVSYIGNPKLMNNTFAEIKIVMPTNKQEQEKIGTLFQKLDTLISLRQTELQKLKNIKKALLNKMFI